MSEAVLQTSASELDDLLNGAVDFGCAIAPVRPRVGKDFRHALDAAQSAGLAAVVLKEDTYPTTPIAAILKKGVIAEDGPDVISGVVLNDHVGGLNPYAVEHELMLGGRVIWMPTLSAGNRIRQSFRTAPDETSRPPTRLNVLDPKGKIIEHVSEILELIAEHDAVLASGHLHVSETLPLFAAAKEAGVTRLIVNDPLGFARASTDDMRELVEMGAHLELEASAFVEGPDRKFEATHLQSIIETAGICRVVVGSGFGKAPNAAPIEGLRALARLLREIGYDAKDIQSMMGGNAVILLGLA